MKNYKFLIFYFFLVLSSTVGIWLFGNPENINWWTNRNLFQLRPPLVLPTQINIKNLNKNDELSNYRYNIEHQAYIPQQMDHNLDIKILVNGFINYGIHGASKASTVVNKEQILVGSDIGMLKSFDHSGKLMWELRNLLTNPGFHSTPSQFRNYFIVGDYLGNIYALDRFNGKIIWILPIGNSVGSSPVITEDGYGYLGIETTHPNGFFIKFNAQTGELIWRTDYLGDHTHSSPTIDIKNNVLVGGDNAGFFNAFDLDTGKLKWQYNIGEPMKSTASLYNGQSIFSTWDGFAYAINNADGKLVWKTKISTTKNQSSFAILKKESLGVINTVEGILKINLDNGKILSYLKMDMGSESKKASPIITDSLVFKGEHLAWTACKKSSFCVLHLENFKILKTWDFEFGISSEATFFNKKIYFSTRRTPGLVSLFPKN